jgi:hypothetical protein
MEDQMATKIPNPVIDSFDIVPVAAAFPGSVTLRAQISMPLKDLDPGTSFQFLAPNGAVISYKSDPHDDAAAIATWPVTGKPKSLLISHIEFRAQLVRGGVPFHDEPRSITVVWNPVLTVRFDSPSNSVIEGDPITALADIKLPLEDFKDFGIDIAWILDDTHSIEPETPVNCPLNTTGLSTGSHRVTAKLVDQNGQAVKKDGKEITGTAFLNVASRPLSRLDTVKVALQRSSAMRTKDQVLWSLIRDRTTALSFTGGGYKQFIDKVLCNPASAANPLVRKRLAGPVSDLGTHAYGMGGYELLKTATEVFLLIECGVAIENSFEGEGFDPDSEAARLGERVSVAEMRNRLTRYLPTGRLPYLDRVVNAVFPNGQSDVKSIFCPDALTSRVTAPCLLELIWSYWHEEGMLVQTMNAISRRFQNVRSPGDRDPLAHLEIDPLRPLNNLLWGYVQDEQNLLTVKRRAYEYDHHYGLTTYGKAVPPLRPADSRSKFLEGFHNLLHLTSLFYKEDNDTTVIADGFPLLNALREVHLLLAQGAHNQFGDLPWTARAEMLMQQWLLSQPQMREFLQSRPMVPYKEAWMGQVDTMKSLQGWSDVTVTHFRDLGAYGEQILLSIRYGDWIDINEEDSAKNWARYWRPEIQSYIHAYRIVTGIDLSNPDTVDSTMPAVHLQKRLVMQRAR